VELPAVELDDELGSGPEEIHLVARHERIASRGREPRQSDERQ
jgi:hypothetical protein